MFLNMNLTGVSVTGTIITLIAVVGIGAIAGLFSERAGVFNIAINGMMVIGGLSYAVISYHVKGSSYNQIWIMLVAGLMAGMFALLHALASIKFKANQIISGTAINLLAPGIAIFWIAAIQKNTRVFVNYNTLSFSKHLDSFAHLISLPLFAIILVVAIGWFTLHKTPFGLKLRACGENPHALGAAGVNVNLVRYVAVFISGVLSGIAGAIFVQDIGSFAGNVNGMGFIALAILIFGRWRIITVFLSAIFFGTLEGIAMDHGALRLTWFTHLTHFFTGKDYAIGAIDTNLLLIWPFIISIIALIITSRKSLAPKAAGKHYDKTQR